MAERNFTPSLIKKKRKGTSLLRALFRKANDNGFYTAVSHDGQTTLWWIEANQLGRTSCYPCVLYRNGEEHAFVSGHSAKERKSNRALIEKWNEAVSPETIDELYTVTELEAEEFFNQFNPAEDRQLKRIYLPEKEEHNPENKVESSEDGE